ncbi:ABC transporter permease [Escherichia coli]|uniref:ABC transporter permease n=1 Tax=Escherichia coli TaxID=562 RepID=A0A377KE39_ECOLX|nr:ABC transporter permease [Escherichia coli]
MGVCSVALSTFFNRAAPVALLAIGMTLVIATGGIDLSVGAVMAIAGATTAAMTVAGFSLPIVFVKRPRHWHPGGIVERHTGSDPQNSAVCRHPDPDGRRARRGATDHLRTDRHI